MIKKFISIILILLAGFFGCSASHTETDTAEPVIFPPPPAETKIQFLKSFSTSKDVTGDLSGIMEYVTGSEEEGQIVKPYGITIYKGKIYICDTILGGLEIIDLENESFEYFIPKGLGLLKKPINCFKDSDGKLYVADTERNQIVVFDINDNYLNAFGESDLKRPTDVFVNENKIFVADVMDKKVKVFNRTSFELENSLPGDEVTENESLFQPTNICVKGDRLYVSDFGDFKIKIYSTDGKFINSVGSYGKGLGQFVRPKGIAVDDSLNLYVADAGFDNVQIFNNEGNLLLFFGGTYNGPGGMWLPAKVVIDYDNLKYFQKYVYPGFDLQYLIFVTNQYGPEKISVYGFVNDKYSKGSR